MPLTTDARGVRDRADEGARSNEARVGCGGNILSGTLGEVPTKSDSIFEIAVPLSCPGVPDDILNPRNTWKDKAAYDLKARELAAMFEKNFAENASDVSAEIKNAGPKQPA